MRHALVSAESKETWEQLLDDLRSEFLLRRGELALLHEIDLRILTNNEGIPETLGFILDETRRLIDADHAEVFLRRGHNLVTAQASPRGASPEDFPHADSALQPCVEDRKTVRFEDLRKDGSVKGYAPRNTSPGVPFSSVLATPIGQRAAGVLYAGAHQPGAFEPIHAEIASAIAAQIAIALEKAELFDHTGLLKTVDHLIFSHEEGEDVVQRALKAVFQELLQLRYTEVSAAQILFKSEGSLDLEIVHSTNEADIGVKVSVDDSVSGRAMKSRETVIVNDVRADPDYKRMLGGDIESEIVVPITIGHDEAPMGVLNVESPNRDAFNEASKVLLERFARQVATLLAFIKLRSDVESALEMRHANDVLAAVGDQTGNVLHKLNNTVGAIRVMIKEVRSHCADEVARNAFLREQLDRMEEAADATLEMPRQMLRSLTQAGDIAEADVNGSIRRAIERLEVPDGVKVEMELEEHIPPVSCFSFELVLDNLMRNAVDAMPDGGMLCVKSCRIAYKGITHERAQVTVSDTGVGMSPETRRRIFEINFTTKPRKDGKGLGFGLWWVKHWIHRSEGEIDVESVKGEGSTFTIKLPLVEADREERA
jgi:signal transduction histidine kinase